MITELYVAHHFVYQIRFFNGNDFIRHYFLQFLTKLNLISLGVVVLHLIGFSVCVKNGVFCQMKQG